MSNKYHSNFECCHVFNLINGNIRTPNQIQADKTWASISHYSKSEQPMHANFIVKVGSHWNHYREGVHFSRISKKFMGSEKAS